MVEGIPLRLFVATPGDLSIERKVVSTVIDEHNARQATDITKFEMVGWESVRGTARRPQEAINDLIGECHYLVALYKKSWGSEPGSPWGYTSGTEEELFTALLQLGQGDRPMRDVWVAFIQNASPAPEITRLREQMSNRHALMYETIADTPDLKSKLTDRLAGWTAIAGPKVARHVNLIPSSGKDILLAATLRRDGEQLVELGVPDYGAEKLKEAAVLGGPPEQLAYARFLARCGQLDAAQASIQSAIDYFATQSGMLRSPLAAEAFAAQAGLLRRQGSDRDAIGRLRHALTLLEEGDPYATAVRCRILDELGLAHQQLGELYSAQQNFELALEERTKQGDIVAVCQSRVNLARFDVAKDDLDSARDHANQALAGLSEIPPSALHANAEVLRAQVLLRQGSALEALENTARAIAINRQIGSRRGEAIALLVSAQCLRASGDVPQAIGHAEQALALNESMGNEFGQNRARWLLDQLRT
jgi:tetratricopeptide (TPR) repeat protein